MYVKERKRQHVFQMLICLWSSLIAMSVSLLIMLDTSKPSFYNLLFLLPLTFSIFSLAFNKVYDEIPQNLGISLIIILFFARTVISPMFMYLGDYSVTITYGIDENTGYAILLMIYELMCIFTFIYAKTLKIKNGQTFKRTEYQYYEDKKGIRAYFFILLALIIVLGICIKITPELLLGYRSIFSVSDEYFTYYEDSQIVSKYGTTFITKLSLVTGQYLMRALLLLIPTYLIIKLSEKRSILRKGISFICCFIPVFFIGGAIAKSLIYAICLLLLYNYRYHYNEFIKKSIRLLIIGICVVLLWWIFKADFANIFKQFSRRFSAYFTGINVVSGVFNLPNNIEYKIRYFLYDFTSTFPYGGTIFNISHETISTFFNRYNYSQGQIAPTIAMGYYYFGPILAPLYSIIFTNIAINAGEKLKSPIVGNPMKYVRIILMIFIFGMGMVMYNIEITMINLFSLILPMYILERIAYKKEVKK